MKKKHELIKYAYDNYPKGSISVHKGTTAKHISTGKFKIEQDGYNGICVLSDSGTECFYSENTNGEYGPTWAEIVEQETEKPESFKLFSDYNLPIEVFKDRIEVLLPNKVILVQKDIDLIFSSYKALNIK